VCHVARSSHSGAGRIEYPDRALTGGLIKDHLVAATMRAGSRVAACGLRERVFESYGCCLVVGVRRLWLCASAPAARDLGFERPDRPASLGGAPRERSAPVVVRLGQERLAVSLVSVPESIRSIARSGRSRRRTVGHDLRSKS
jgi:hypothetical protein